MRQAYVMLINFSQQYKTYVVITTSYGFYEIVDIV